MKSRKMVLMNLLQGRSRDADTENRLLDTVGEGEGGMKHIYIHITYMLYNIYIPYVKQIASRKLL